MGAAARRLVGIGMLLLDYDAVEGVCAVLSHGLYIKAVGSEGDEKVSNGCLQCLTTLIDGRRNNGDGGFCASWPGPYCWNARPLRE